MHYASRLFSFSMNHDELYNTAAIADWIRCPDVRFIAVSDSGVVKAVSSVNTRREERDLPSHAATLDPDR